jgi:hypothetical protein
MWETGRWGSCKPLLSWVDPVEVIKALLLNPELNQPGAFAYGPEFLNGDEELETIQLHHSAWFHKAQHTVGKENMVIAVITNSDGTNTTSKNETIFLYLRMGNENAPGCFSGNGTKLIGIIPDIKWEDVKFQRQEDFQRAKQKLYHDCIDKIFENFHEASKKYTLPSPTQTF